MLSQTTYPQPYIYDCRVKAAALLESYDQMIAAAGPKAADNPAVVAFDHEMFANMVVALDGYFTHRARAQELKDGNPANEVRVLAASILTGGGILQKDKTIKQNPATSVLGLKVGEPIRLRKDDFSRLADAYFDEIERKYT